MIYSVPSLQARTAWRALVESQCLRFSKIRYMKVILILVHCNVRMMIDHLMILCWFRLFFLISGFFPGRTGMVESWLVPARRGRNWRLMFNLRWRRETWEASLSLSQFQVTFRHWKTCEVDWTNWVSRHPFVRTREAWSPLPTASRASEKK